MRTSCMGVCAPVNTPICRAHHLARAMNLDGEQDHRLAHHAVPSIVALLRDYEADSTP